jgi:putative holliday junction resolvase
MEITLAVDYGHSRTGTAVSAGWMARPLEVLHERAPEALITRLLVLARQEMATRFLVGLPVNADGTEGEQAQSARQFARQLAAATALPVYLWNEYGSSQAAQAQMIGANTRRKARREKLDAIAAAVFLQEYVEQGGDGAEQVLPESKPADEG